MSKHIFYFLNQIHTKEQYRHFFLKKDIEYFTRNRQVRDIYECGQTERMWYNIIH
jgi:hypothetical protein